MVADTLQRSQWFRNLPAELRADLLALGKERELAPSEFLFARGEQPCGVYAVLDGAIRILGVSSQGKEAVLTLVEAPQWFGEIALFDGGVRTHDAQAESSTRLWHLSQEVLTGLLGEKPAYWRFFGQLLTEKLRLAFMAIEDIALLPAAARLSRRLLLLADARRQSGHSDPDSFSFSQELLGAMVGLSRQTTNQILRDLETRGLIALGRGRISLLDAAGLLELSHSDE